MLTERMAGGASALAGAMILLGGCALGASVDREDLSPSPCASCDGVDASARSDPASPPQDAAAPQLPDAAKAAADAGVASSQITCTETSVRASSVAACNAYAAPKTTQQVGVPVSLGPRPREPGSPARSALFVGSSALLGFVSLPSDGVYLLADRYFVTYTGLGTATVMAGVATLHVDVERMTTCQKIHVVCDGTATLSAP